MIVLGRVVAPYGVRGWLKVKPFADDPDAWRVMPQWWLAKDVAADDDWQAFKLEGLRPHGAGWIAKFAEVGDRAAAEGLDGWFFGAPREDLPRNEGNEYYWADLIGLEVVNEQGESLGRIESLIETGAHDVLQVKDGETKRLLPFVGQVMKDVDVAGGRIRVAWGSDW
jgi:16S rRNA processing protein RimM